VSAPTWIETRTADGSWTLVHAGLNEGCHSLAGAWQQATERYARACRLEESARAAADGRVRLLDLGTGLGLNLAAALVSVEGAGGRLEALSLELEPAVLVAGCALYERAELAQGPWAAPHAEVRRALRAALAGDGRAGLGRGTLELRLGDARATLPDPPRTFEAVFLDPFSPGRAGELWEPGFLARVAALLAPGGWLSTYSAAFRVRLALAAAGLEVGQGARVGTKGEGTLARREAPVPPLPPRVSARLRRRLAGAQQRPGGPVLGIPLSEQRAGFD